PSIIHDERVARLYSEVSSEIAAGPGVPRRGARSDVEKRIDLALLTIDTFPDLGTERLAAERAAELASVGLTHNHARLAEGLVASAGRRKSKPSATGHQHGEEAMTKSRNSDKPRSGSSERAGRPADERKRAPADERKREPADEPAPDPKVEAVLAAIAELSEE